MEPLSDLELIKAYEGGDDSALDVLIRQYLPRVYGFLLRMVGDRHLAEDLTQETFVKVWRKLKTFDKRKSFKTWILTIAKNSAIDHLRKKTPDLILDEPTEEGTMIESVRDTQPLAHEMLERKDLRHEIEKALTHVSLKARSVILMHEVEQFTFQEIAEVMKESVNTVKSRYRRALIELRQLLKKGKITLD